MISYTIRDSRGRDYIPCLVRFDGLDHRAVRRDYGQEIWWFVDERAAREAAMESIRHRALEGVEGAEWSLVVPE